MPGNVSGLAGAVEHAGGLLGDRASALDRREVAPSYVKVPTVEMANLMLDALEASATATNLVIIGTALRHEDGFLTVVLTQFLRQPSWRTRRIFIVDLEANAIRRRLEKFWGVDVSSQIVTIEAPLEDSVVSLAESILKRKPRCGLG